MIKPKINTDKVISDTQKALYDLRDIDHQAMSKKEKEVFIDELNELEDLAKSILSKIKTTK